MNAQACLKGKLCKWSELGLNGYRHGAMDLLQKCFSVFLSGLN